LAVLKGEISEHQKFCMRAMLWACEEGKVFPNGQISFISANLIQKQKSRLPRHGNALSKVAGICIYLFNKKNNEYQEEFRKLSLSRCIQVLLRITAVYPEMVSREDPDLFVLAHG
jgi:hypothetical protein